MKYRFLTLIILACLSVYGIAQAQSIPSQLLYSPTTPEYLAKSYWPLKKLDLQDDRNIDQYLLITECDLFRQYYSDDLEWSKIRAATRNYVQKNMDGFPTRFEFIQPLYLDRYDTASQSFAVLPDSQMKGVSQIQASGNNPSDYKCLKTQYYNPKLFPMNAILNLSRPFSYTSVKAKPEDAQEYIKYLQDNNLANPLGRPAFIRYRFKVEQSLDPVNRNNGLYANFFGTLESVTVFGDINLFIKLEDVNF